jgi:glycosyltransferase involved in cell wall biosynthesis
MKPRVSIIIPSYNQPGTIERCLQSLSTQRTTVPFEVVVVDSSPPDVQVEIEAVCRIDDRVRLHKEAKQTFPGTARNIGIREARGEIVALIDADCVAHGDWVEQIHQNVAEGEVLSGVIENGTPGSVAGTCGYWVEFSDFLPFESPPKQAGAAATCNFACMKKLFDQVGYFSGYRAFEDFFFCERLRQGGGRVVLVNEVRVTHLNKTSTRDIVRNLDLLGYFSAVVRKENGLPPRIAFQYPILSLGLFAYRFISVGRKVIQSGEAWRFLKYSPLVAYFLWRWNIGFYRGSKN